MPIRTACQCGKAFAAPDNLAGKTVKCPNCGQALRVPAAGGAAGGGAAPQRPAAAPQRPAAPRPQAPAMPMGGIGDLLDEVGIAQHAGPRCPACDSPVAPHAVVCVKCGFNRQTGTKMQSDVRTGPREVGHGEAASSLMERAAREVEAAPVHTDDNDTGGVGSVWTWIFLLFLPLLFFAGFAVAILWGGTLSFPAMIIYGAVKNDSYWYIIPALIIGGGILLTAFGWLNITSVALERNVWHGLACMIFVGSYCYYWGMMQWQWARSSMQTYLTGIWILNFGITLFFVFIMFEVGLYVSAVSMLIVFGGNVVAFFAITFITLTAAEEGLGHGLACLLTGIYTLIYGFMRWSKCSRDMILYFIGFGIVVVGMIGVVVGFGANASKFNERLEKARKAAANEEISAVPTNKAQPIAWLGDRPASRQPFVVE